MSNVMIASVFEKSGRMDNLSVGYNFGDFLGNKKSNLKVTAMAQNLFVITNYSGVDPEVFGKIMKPLQPKASPSGDAKTAEYLLQSELRQQRRTPECG